MKKIYFLLFSILLVACTDKSALRQIQYNDGSIGLSESSVEIAPDGANPVIVLYCAEDSWSIRSIPNWLSVSITQGKAGVHSITLSASPGQESGYKQNIRTTSLSFLSGGREDVLKVTQQRPYLYVVRKDVTTMSEADDVDRTFCWNEYYGTTTPFELEIVSNVKWSYALEFAERYKVNQSTERDESDIFKSTTKMQVVPLDHNFDKVPLFSSLSFNGLSSKSGEVISQNFIDKSGTEWKLAQKNLRFLINGKYEPVSLRLGELTYEYAEYDTEEEESPVQTLVIDTELSLSDISVTNNLSWISASIDRVDSLVVLKATEVNRSDKDRDGKISINLKADGDVVNREISLTQRPYILKMSSSKTSERFRNQGCDSCVISVTTKGPWNYSVPDWIVAEDMEGSKLGTTFSRVGPGSFKILVKDQNLDFSKTSNQFVFSEKKGVVTIDGLKSVRVQKSFSQDAFEFLFTNDKTNDYKNIPALGSDQNLPVHVVSSGDWYINNLSAYKLWLTSSMDSGTPATSVFNLQVPGSNDMDVDRTAILRVVSKNHERAGKQVYFDIEVRQHKYVWEISSESLNVAAYDPRYKDPSSSVSGGSLILKCSGKWEISNTASSWLKVSKSSGEKSDVGEEICFIPDLNSSNSIRNTEITIRDLTRGKELGLSIKQDPFVFLLVSGQETNFSNLSEVNPDPCSISFRISQNAPFQFSTSSWINFKQLASTTKDRVTTYEFNAVIDNNLQLSERSASINLFSSLSSVRHNFTFVQKEFVFDSNTVTLDEFQPLAELDGQTQTCPVACSAQWSIKSCPSWITVKPASGIGNSALTISSSNNSSEQKRSGSIVVLSTLNNLTKTINVSQGEFFFSSDASSKYSFEPVGNAPKEFTVKSTGGWAVKSAPSWIKIDPSSVNREKDVQTKAIKLTVSDNHSIEPRSSTVVLVSNEIKSREISFLCEQKAFIFDVSTDALAFNADDVNPKSFTVSCTQDWEVLGSAEWVTLSVTSGSGNGDVVVTVSKNESGQERSQAFVVKCTNAPELSKTVIVTQNKQ